MRKTARLIKKLINLKNVCLWRKSLVCSSEIETSRVFFIPPLTPFSSSLYSHSHTLLLIPHFSSSLSALVFPLILAFAHPSPLALPILSIHTPFLFPLSALRCCCCPCLSTASVLCYLLQPVPCPWFRCRLPRHELCNGWTHYSVDLVL